MRFRLIIVILFWAIHANSQLLPERPAYDKMLQGLLSHNVAELTVKQVTDTSRFIFLDARSMAEFEVSHIPSAIWVGYEEFDQTSVQELDKGKVAVVYCSVGYRSEKVAKQLMENGFDNVANLYGGIFQWVYEGNEVVNSSGPTKQVHAYDSVWGIWLSGAVKVY